MYSENQDDICRLCSLGNGASVYSESQDDVCRLCR